jgi:hypothetical protein
MGGTSFDYDDYEAILHFGRGNMVLSVHGFHVGAVVDIIAIALLFFLPSLRIGLNTRARGIN